MDTSDSWIQERTGISERRFVEDNQGPSDIAIPAIEICDLNREIMIKALIFNLSIFLV